MQPHKPSQITETVDFDASAQSSAFLTGITVVRVVADQNCHIKFGADPTATVENIYLPAGVVEYFRVTKGEKVAVIKNTTAGILYVTPMTQ